MLTEPPQHLRQVVFDAIAKEKKRAWAIKRLWLRVGLLISVVSSIVTLAVFGKEIITSDFFSIAELSLSDMRTVAPLWQDYFMSLLETVPTVSIAVTLLPIFIALLLLRQYAKLEQYGRGYSFRH